jgi:hypothetical protein
MDSAMPSEATVLRDRPFVLAGTVADVLGLIEAPVAHTLATPSSWESAALEHQERLREEHQRAAEIEHQYQEDRRSIPADRRRLRQLCGAKSLAYARFEALLHVSNGMNHAEYAYVLRAMVKGPEALYALAEECDAHRDDAENGGHYGYVAGWCRFAARLLEELGDDALWLRRAAQRLLARLTVALDAPLFVAATHDTGPPALIRVLPHPCAPHGPPRSRPDDLNISEARAA